MLMALRCHRAQPSTCPCRLSICTSTCVELEKLGPGLPASFLRHGAARSCPLWWLFSLQLRPPSLGNPRRAPGERNPAYSRAGAGLSPSTQGQLGASALIWGAGSKAALSPSAWGTRGSPANSSALAFFSAEAEPSSGREASAGPARASSPGRMGLAPAAPGLRGERRGKQPFRGRGF